MLDGGACAGAIATNMNASISERAPNPGSTGKQTSEMPSWETYTWALLYIYIACRSMVVLGTNAYVMVCCLIPPSRTTLEPVRNEARSEAKKATKSPTSSGFPRRPIGMPEIVSRIRSSKALPDS